MTQINMISALSTIFRAKQLNWMVLCCLVLMQSGPAFASGEIVNLSRLQGRWVLNSINEHPLNEGNYIYFEIDALTITGFDGCNKFGGRLDALSRLRMSQRACVNNETKLPLKLTDPWPQLNASEVSGDKLTMPLPDGAGKACFNRQ